jgi:hypothetical protein
MVKFTLLSLILFYNRIWEIIKNQIICKIINANIS